MLPCPVLLDESDPLSRFSSLQTGDGNNQHHSRTLVLVFFTMNDADEHVEQFVDSWPVMTP